MKKLIALLFVAACGGTPSNESGRFSPEPKNTTASEQRILYADLLSGVLQPKCIACHPGFKTEAGIAEIYVAGDPQNSPLYVLTQSGQMPQGGPKLSDASLELIRRFIVDAKTSTGADNPQTTPPETTPPPEQEIPIKASYASLQHHLFEKSCIACHATGKREPDLSNRDEIEHEAKDILEALDEGEMPPQKFKGPRPTDEILAAFKAWKDSGFKDAP